MSSKTEQKLFSSWQKSVLAVVDAENRVLVARAVEEERKEKLRSIFVLEPETRLTPREKQVLREVLLHKQNKEIANDLHIHLQTAKYHVSSILRKFGKSRRGDLQSMILIPIRGNDLVEEHKERR